MPTSLCLWTCDKAFRLPPTPSLGRRACWSWAGGLKALVGQGRKGNGKERLELTSPVYPNMLLSRSDTGQAKQQACLAPSCGQHGPQTGHLYHAAEEGTPHHHTKELINFAPRFPLSAVPG